MKMKLCYSFVPYLTHYFEVVRRKIKVLIILIIRYYVAYKKKVHESMHFKFLKIYLFLFPV